MDLVCGIVVLRSREVVSRNGDWMVGMVCVEFGWVRGSGVLLELRGEAVAWLLVFAELICRDTGGG